MPSVKELEKGLEEYKSAEKAKIRAERGRWRRFVLWVRYFLVTTWKWLFVTLRDWKSWLVFAGVAAAMGSSVWVGFILYWAFGWPWALAMATGSLFFWNCVPFTPFIPICLLLTTGILKIFRRRR